MSSEDIDYYRRRAITERVNAQQANRAKVAAIHDELAQLYDALVQHEELRPTLRLAFPRKVADFARS